MFRCCRFLRESDPLTLSPESAWCPTSNNRLMEVSYILKHGYLFYSFHWGKLWPLMLQQMLQQMLEDWTVEESVSGTGNVH